MKTTIGKLRRVIAYIKSTIYDCRTMEVTELTNIFIWIDAAYTVDPDMRIQTGDVISMGIDV